MSIPEELKQLNNWILWKKGLEKDNGRFYKRPLNLDGSRWQGKETWGYQEALDAASKLFPDDYNNLHGGIAFSLNHTPYVVLDLDISRERMILHALLLAEFRTTYIEESISMKGYHIVVKDSMARLFVEESLGLSVLAHSDDESAQSCWVILTGAGLGNDWLNVGPGNPIQEINLKENGLMKQILEIVEEYELAQAQYEAYMAELEAEREREEEEEEEERYWD